MLTNLSVLYDNFVGVPILRLYLLWGQCPLSIVSKQCLKCESASRRFKPGEGLSRGLFRDCETFADGLFAALSWGPVSAVTFASWWLGWAGADICRRHGALQNTAASWSGDHCLQA